MEILKYIDRNRREVIELTKELVKIPTVNPPGKNYERIVSFLDSYCKGLRLKTKKVYVPASVLRRYKIDRALKRVNLLAEWNIGAGKNIHINCHYDVVPATGGWKTNPFNPKIKNGRIYGRGTEDMKANIAALLFALRGIKVCGLRPCYNLGLSFTPDEEIGGRTGFGYLVDKGYIRADFVIGEGYHGNFVSYGNKGMLWFKIEVLGKSCHASEPYRGINSFEKMVMVANELIKLKRRVEKQSSRFGTKDPRSRHPSIVLGGELYGGKKTNIVPDNSVFTIDRRLLPEETIGQAKREVFEAIDKLKKKDKDLKVNITVLAEEVPVISKKANIFFDSFSCAIKKVLRKKPRFAILSGGTDPRFLMRKGIPAIGYSVDGGDSCHGDNEYVKIKSLVDTAKIFALFFLNKNSRVRG